MKHIHPPVAVAAFAFDVRMWMYLYVPSTPPPGPPNITNHVQPPQQQQQPELTEQARRAQEVEKDTNTPAPSGLRILCSCKSNRPLSFALEYLANPVIERF